MACLKLFGARVKELRKRKRLTQEQLGELAGIDCKQIGNIETGTYFTTMPTLERIAAALEVDMEELFKFQHNKTREALINEIKKLLKEADYDKVKIIYKITKSVLM